MCRGFIDATLLPFPQLSVEKCSYRVYEIEELYTEEPHNDLDRHIVSKELIGAGYGKMFSFYALMDERNDRPYCVPDDFLSYAEPTASVEEKSLAVFIGNLKSTANGVRPKTT